MRPGTKSLRRFLDVRGDGCRRGPRRRHLRNTRVTCGRRWGLWERPPHTPPGPPRCGRGPAAEPAVPCPDAGDTEHPRTRLLAVRIHVSVHLPLPGRLSPPAPGRLRARRGCRQARAEGTVSQTGASSSSHVAALLPKLTPCQVPDDDPDLEAAQLLHPTVTARSRVSLLRAPRLSGIAARAWHEVGCSASPMRTGECPGHGCQV